MFEDGVAVGHAGEVIADGAGPALLFGAFAGEFADFVWMIEVLAEEVLEHAHRATIGVVDFRVKIEVLV